MTTTDDQIKPQLPLGFIFLHFFIGLLLAFAVTAVGAVIYAYLDAPEATRQLVHIQPLIAGFYLGYRSAKAQADNLSFYYTLFLAIFCYFTLIEVVLFLNAIAYVIDENYLADGLALIEEFGIISLLLVVVPFIIFHIFMIGLGLSGGIKFYERSKAANAKREKQQALKAQSQDGSPQDKTKPKNKTLSSILIIIISVLGLYYLLPVTPVEFGKARLADILQLAGRHEESLALRDELATGRPDDVKFLFYRGISHSLLDNNEAAIADYDRVIALGPTHNASYLNRGSAKADLGRYEAAIADYTQAIALQYYDAKAYYGRGIAKAALGRYEAAIADYDQALSFNPRYKQAYNNRGIAKANLCRYEAAIADYDQAIALQSHNAKAYNNRGVAKADLGRYEAAIMDYDQALSLDVKFVTAYHNRGVAKAKLGRYEAAIMDFTEAIRLNPKWAKAYRDRSSAYRQLGKTAQAKADCDKAQALSVSLINCF